MAWCFSSRTSVAAVLVTHSCTTWCLWVNLVDCSDVSSHAVPINITSCFLIMCLSQSHGVMIIFIRPKFYAMLYPVVSTKYKDIFTIIYKLWYFFFNKRIIVVSKSLLTMNNKGKSFSWSVGVLIIEVLLHMITGFYTKGRPLVKSNLICPSDKLNWQPCCPVLNIDIQGNFCISQRNGSSDNLPENLV